MNINKLQSFQKTVEIHRANMQRSLERRLQVARARKDENLIGQLEAEQNYYN